MAAPATAAPVLVTAHATVDLDASGAADVQIEYTVSGGAVEDVPAEVLTFSALAFGAAEVSDVEVSTPDGQTLQTSLEDAGLKTVATVTLPSALEPGQQLELVVRYAVLQTGTPDGDQLNAFVPMLALDYPPAATAPGVFTAEIALPTGHEYISGFPSTPENLSAEDGRNVVAYQVSASTSLLRSQSTTGAVSFFTLETTLELLVLLLILLAAAACYGYFVRQRALNRSGGDPPAEGRADLQPTTAPVTPPRSS